MIVGTLTVILSVPGSVSLKDKRHVVKSILDHSRHRFNVSASEIGHLDSRRTAELGFACVSNSVDVMTGMLNRILDHIESNPLCEVTDSHLEML